MNEFTAPGAYGRLTEPATLKIQRLLPGPIERVWAYLTESGLRRLWLAAGEMEMKVGAAFEFVWRNDELTDPPGKRPPGVSDVHRMRSQIIALDPPRKLVIAWGANGDGEVSFELDPKGNEVLLTVIHRRLPDRTTTLMVGAGWHMHLDILVARASGKEAEPFWDGWSRLRQEYDRRLPA
jgi:uncharacterized protein YndB with AHSA1/START domain